MSDPAPRFQFSLADIFAATLSMVLPAVAFSRLDLEELEFPDRLLIAVIVGLVVGLIAAVLYRRELNSRSPLFVPPFVLFFHALFLLPFGNELRSPFSTILAFYVLLFPPVVTWLLCERTNARRRIVPTAIWTFAGMIAVSILSPGFPSNRLGMNETSAGVAIKNLAEAQEIYNRFDRDNDGVREYSGTMRGLFESKPGAADLALIDRALADADATLKSPTPRSGYFFLLLKAQGTNATGGAKSYLDVKGNLTGGYAFIAFPARYKKTGFSTFVICSDSTIRQKDLGPQTEAIVKAMTVFDPDSSWSPSE